MENLKVFLNLQKNIILKLKRFLIKRFLDIFLSTISIFILSPLFIIIGLFIKYDSKGDILYRGVRSGLKNQPFRILKFRTMVENAEQLGGFYNPVAEHIPNTLGYPVYLPYVDQAFARFKINAIDSFGKSYKKLLLLSFK